MRLIDADAIIKEIKERNPDDVSYEDAWAITCIEHAPTIEPQRWIPCSERLPEEDTDILVTYVDGEETRIIPVNYGRGTWFDCIFDRALDSLNVIAWMPLPEPYRKEGEEI